MGHAPAPVLPAQLPQQPARSELPQPRRAGRAARRRDVLAGAGCGRLPPRRHQLLLSRRGPARQPGARRAADRGPHRPVVQPLLVATPPPRQEPARSAGLPAPPAQPGRSISRHHHGRRDRRRGRPDHGGRLHRRQRQAAHGVLLHPARYRPRRALSPRHDSAVPAGGGRRLALLGAVQPRRRAGGHALGRRAPRPAPAAPGRGFPDEPARHRLPLPG